MGKYKNLPYPHYPYIYLDFVLLVQFHHPSLATLAIAIWSLVSSFFWWILASEACISSEFIMFTNSIQIEAENGILTQGSNYSLQQE